MSSDWDEIQRLFEAALEQPKETRREFLKRELGSDRAAIERIEAMIAADAHTALPVDRPPSTLSDELIGDEPPAPERVGPYRIDDVLGRGGMGVVYRGVRDDLGSFAAIKVLHGTALSPLRRELFDRERRVLATLQHPGIARIYDAGTLDDGTPYFVMEAVEGLPLARACRERDLSIEERLRLFLEICAAVQYAHARGVIHRDLKSSNLLVPAGERPAIKLLDFGIALRVDHASDGVETAAYTPAYAAPEQVASEPATMLADVYTLGVLLFEILANRLPDPAKKRMDGNAVDSCPSKSRERVSGGTRGDWDDLDAICTYAMALQPERRYSTVDALAEDVRRMLEHRPTLALSSSRWTPLRKFVRRHRPGVALAGLALIGLVVAGATIVIQSRRIAEQRDIAIAEQAAAEQLAGFLVDVFRSSDPATTRGQEVSARELLDTAAARLLNATEGSAASEQRPADRVRFLHAIARAYDRLGVYEQQAVVLQAARNTVVPEGVDSASDALLRAEQAGALLQLGRLEEAGALLDEKTAGPIPENDRLALLSKRAHLRWLQGNLEEAEALFLEVIPGLKTLSGGDTGHRYFQVVANLGSVYSHQARFEEAGELYTEAIAELNRRLGSDHPTTLSQRGNLATLLLRRQLYEEARTMLLPLLEDKRRVLGEDHVDTLRSVNGLAIAEHYVGNLEEAEALFREALAASEETLPEGHRETLALIANLAAVLVDRGEVEEGRDMHRRVYEGFRDQLGPRHRFTGLTLHNVAGANTLLGAHARAEIQYREAQSILGEALPAGHPELAMNLKSWIELRTRAGDTQGVKELEARLAAVDNGG